MNFTYENQGINTYLVYNVAENDIVDSMSLGMLTNNRIPGLAHTLYTQMDSKLYFKYDVSAKISVRQFFDVVVNRRRLLGVFNGIINAMLSSEEYMIDPNAILLDLDYIFADVSTCETVLICLPIVSDELRKRDLGAFFKNIMFTTQFDQNENCDYVARIINYLNSALVFSLYDFKRVLDSISQMPPVTGNFQPQYPQQPPVQQFPPQYAPTRQQTVNQPVQQERSPQQQMPQNQYAVSAQQRQVPPNASVQQGQIPQNPPVQQGQAPQNAPGQVPNNPQKFQVPPTQQGAPKPAQEKKGSRFSFFKSHNKDNADGGKAPKAAQGSTVPSQQPNVPVASHNKKQQPQPGFAVPGQTPPQQPGYGFAVPGQQNPYPNMPQQQQGYQQQGYQQSQRPPMQQPAHQRPMQQTPQQPAQPMYQPAPMPQGQSMNFGETTVLSGGGGIGETTVLGAAPTAQADPHLLRAKNNEKIKLNKPVFRIGKEKSYVDYFIGDNPAISRSHANVIIREGQYFVVDTNSTNHTYVNGMMIQSNVETPISHGTKIRLGNEEFEFKLY